MEKKLPIRSFTARLPQWLIAGKPQSSGLALALWWLYARLYLYKVSWVPQPSSIVSYKADTKRLTELLTERRQQAGSIVTVLTKKGGATKTTVSTWLAATLWHATKLAVTIFDLDVGGGNVAKRFAVNPDKTLTSDLFVRLAAQKDDQQWSPEYADMVKYTLADKETGVVIIHSVPKPGESISGIAARRALAKVKTTCHTLIVDTAPGFDVQATRGALAISEVCLVVGDANSGEDLDAIEATLNHPTYNLRENIKQVVIVISGLRWPHLTTRTQYQFAERFKVEPEQIVLIPFDTYIRNKQNIEESHIQARPVRLNALNSRVRHSWYLLANTVSERATAYNMLHSSASLLQDNAPRSEVLIGSEPESVQHLDASSIDVSAR
jgi:cellulose biosynthesis protein BcsQ